MLLKIQNDFQRKPVLEGTEILIAANNNLHLSRAPFKLHGSLININFS
jgi:hypothetical protein